MKCISLVLLLAVLVVGCHGALDACRNQPGFSIPMEGTNSYLSYIYAGDSTSCTGVTPACNASIPPVPGLRSRSWFVDDTKEGNGLTYKPSWIQIYNVQCPVNTYLHLFPQKLDTERGDGATNDMCTMFDFVSVNIPGMDPVLLCGGELQRNTSSLYNLGLGMVLTGGNNATVEFCSNDNTLVGSGFVIRATCLDPTEAYFPGCVEFSSADRAFIDRIFEPIPTAMKINIPHKRSIDPKDLPAKQARLFKLHESGKLHRHKRFAMRFFTFPLEAGDSATYNNNELKVTFSNGTMRTFSNLPWLVTFNDIVRTKVFDINAPNSFNFQGPGKVEISGDIGFLTWTLQDPTVLLTPSIEEKSIINRIYDYMYNNYVSAYPIIEETLAVTPAVEAFPLPNTTTSDPRYHNVNNLDFVREMINSGSCRRATRIEIAPARTSRIEANVIDFCRFFWYSCNPMLRTACMQLINLDRFSG